MTTGHTSQCNWQFGIIINSLFVFIHTVFIQPGQIVHSCINYQHNGHQSLGLSVDGLLFQLVPTVMSSERS